MRAVPQAGFIAERVILDAAVLGIAECADEMLNPGLFEGRAVRDVSIGDGVAGDVRAAAGDAVAPVGPPRIDRLLRAVFVDAVAAEDRAIGSQFRGPVK